MTSDSLIEKIRNAGGYGVSGHLCRVEEVIDIIRQYLADPGTVEAVARTINEKANKKYNAYQLGKHESFDLAADVLSVIGGNHEK